MENSKIKCFLMGEYRDVEYNYFINTFIKTGFFIYDVKTINEFLFKPLKISEEFQEKILNDFKNEILKLEEYLKTQQEDKEYLDKLYNYLHNLGFFILKQNEKIQVLKCLNVKDYLIQKIINDFEIKEKKKT